MPSGIQVFASIRNPDAPSQPAARPRTAIRLLFGEALREALAHHRLALGPKRLRVLPIKRVGTHAGEGEAFGVNGLCDVAILAIPAADLVSFPHHGRPDRGR